MKTLIKNVKLVKNEKFAKKWLKNVKLVEKCKILLKNG